MGRWVSASASPAAVGALAATAALVGGCATVTPTSSVTGTASSAPAGTSPGTAAPGIPVIRLGDDGSTVRVELGRTAVLFLPTEGWVWSDPRPDSPVVSVSEDVSDAGSASRSWTLTALERGVATVTATGTPTCRDAADPCTAVPRSFAVDVVVP